MFLNLFSFFFLEQHPAVGQGFLIHEVSRSHTTSHYTQYDSSGRVISLSQRHPPANKQHLQQRDIHAPCGIQTHNLSRRAAADVRFRPHDHWDWLSEFQILKIIPKFFSYHQTSDRLRLLEKSSFNTQNAFKFAISGTYSKTIPNLGMLLGQILNWYGVMDIRNSSFIYS
jgi:hypothetical protein